MFPTFWQFLGMVFGVHMFVFTLTTAYYFARYMATEAHINRMEARICPCGCHDEEELTDAE